MSAHEVAPRVKLDFACGQAYFLGGMGKSIETCRR